MQFSITTEIDAPPDVVVAVLTDVERRPEWTPTVSRVERLDDAGAPLALGSWVCSCPFQYALIIATCAAPR